VFTVGTGSASLTRIAVAGVFMGAGIVTMHYVGMQALHASLHMTHQPFWVATSILVGAAASGIALWLGFGAGAKNGGTEHAGTRDEVLLPAVLLALAISAMHYSAMAGLTFQPHATAAPVEMPALSPGLLAIVVSVVAFLVSALFLLTLIPEQGRSRSPASQHAGAPDRDAALPEPATKNGSADEAALRVPPARVRVNARSLPVEKDGLQRQFDVARLVAVQAQAHYTTLFDGEVQWFCPLSISEVEAALDPTVFARIHRSHIVNLDRVSALKGTADAAEVAMTARTPYRAPVSRPRQRWLKQRLGERLHPAE
jgi:diguanylate cyclase